MTVGTDRTHDFVGTEGARFKCRMKGDSRGHHSPMAEKGTLRSRRFMGCVCKAERLGLEVGVRD